MRIEQWVTSSSVVQSFLCILIFVNSVSRSTGIEDWFTLSPVVQSFLCILIFINSVCRSATKFRLSRLSSLCNVFVRYFLGTLNLLSAYARRSDYRELITEAKKKSPTNQMVTARLYSRQSIYLFHTLLHHLL
jgi:hypothetical protein